MSQELVLIPGEEIIWKGQANMFFRSPNPLVKIMMFIMKILMFVVGQRVTGTLVITSQRVFFTYNKFFLWFFRYASGRIMLSNKRIAAISYGFEASFLVFFKTIIVSIASTGQHETSLALKGVSEKELNQKFSELFDRMLMESRDASDSNSVAV